MWKETRVCMMARALHTLRNTALVTKCFRDQRASHLGGNVIGLAQPYPQIKITDGLKIDQEEGNKTTS